MVQTQQVTLQSEFRNPGSRDTRATTRFRMGELRSLSRLDAPLDEVGLGDLDPTDLVVPKGLDQRHVLPHHVPRNLGKTWKGASELKNAMCIQHLDM